MLAIPIAYSLVADSQCANAKGWPFTRCIPPKISLLTDKLRIAWINSHQALVVKLLNRFYGGRGVVYMLETDQKNPGGISSIWQSGANT